MAARHKLQHAGVFIRSRLPAAQLFALAEQAAAETRGVGRYRKSPVRIVLTGSSADHRAFAVVNGGCRAKL